EVKARIEAAENEVTALLSHLEALGVLHPRNCMALDELVNPKMEGVMHHEGSEDEIYQAILDWHAAEENGETDGGNDTDEALDEKPSRQDALLAAATL
ncbi:hypothetical protein C0991_001329, partial [Blastosporella zonata]